MINIGPLQPADRLAWEALFGAYLRGYGRSLEAAWYERAWREFMADERMHALGARIDGRLIGVAQFLEQASTSSADSCYLQDLFTAQEARGRGAGRALIAAVTDWARARGCTRIHWLADADNAPARRLYDTIAENSGFIRYEIELF
jgi:GNAT superfamily N-acetyltransferase